MRISALVALQVLLLSSGCGGDDGGTGGGTGGGCTTDDECKGDRICEAGVCVDPHSGSSGTSGSAGSSGTSGASAGSGGKLAAAGSGGAIDDPEFEEACIENCKARQAAGCTMNVGSLDQCMAQCLVLDETNFSYCLDEQTTQYACQASGGYTCVSGYPQPKSTCANELQAVSMCQQKAPCRAFCDRAAGECAPDGSACVDSCYKTQTGFEDAICGVYYSQLLSCWGQSLTCKDGKPAVGSCGAQVAQVGDCIGRRQHVCDGYCWVADALGCGGADCVSNCKAKADVVGSCGSYYRNLVDCAIGDHALQMSCENGEPTPSATACSSYIQQYTMCMQNM
ncbi:MAG TPA: hypothetical protein VJR89_22760 [Polyangiales bacterium]|nr:hypothetical protein [Polyangiales bacterium]